MEMGELNFKSTTVRLENHYIGPQRLFKELFKLENFFQICHILKKFFSQEIAGICFLLPVLS